jgi:hypothetical protein
VYDSYGLSKYKFRSASFNEDARGRWYFIVVVEVEVKQSAGTAAVGIDLGCKDAATDSTGHQVKGRDYRALIPKFLSPIYPLSWAMTMQVTLPGRSRDGPE